MHLERGLLAGVTGRKSHRHIYATSSSAGPTSLFLVCGTLVLVYLVACYQSGQHTWGRRHDDSKVGAETSNSDVAARSPANSTLGFGAIFAVSRAGSKRRAELIRAANLTGLEIQIPSQPIWTNLDEAEFRAQPPFSSQITRGSILAWFGHLNALRWFLSTDLETALIIEDDSDFDISLRQMEIPLASRAAHVLFNTTLDSHGHHYWSDLARWELLYLGHCGDWFDSWALPETLHHIYPDPTMPDPERVFGPTAAQMNNLSVPVKHRIFHRSRHPLCTFAYAVHRTSAARLLESSRSEGKGCQAFDVRVLELCRDWGWGCYSVNPELFHHETAHSEISIINTDPQHDDDEIGEQLKSQGRLEPSVNIRCGARMPELATMMEEQGRMDGELEVGEMLREDGKCPWEQAGPETEAEPTS